MPTADSKAALSRGLPELRLLAVCATSKNTLDSLFPMWEHTIVNVITHRRLKEFGDIYTDAAEPLDIWYKRARKAKWQNLNEVQDDYPHADSVGSCTVFNIKGNSYRLIVKIIYRRQAIYVKNVLTHAEYNKGGWKNDCK